jgi:hypothetical protein
MNLYLTFANANQLLCIVVKTPSIQRGILPAVDTATLYTDLCFAPQSHHCTEV